MKSLCIFIAVMAGNLASALAIAEQAPCSSGWLTIQAEVVRIDPPGNEVTKRTAKGEELPLAANDVLCDGDTLIVPSGTSVELYEAGRTRIYAAESRYTVKRGAASAVSKGAEYLKMAFQTLASLETPKARPNATSSRGSQPVSADAALPIQPILQLRELPRQEITADLPVVVSWRDGVASYSCEAVSADSQLLWSAGNIEAGWCEFPPQLAAAARLQVRDSRRRSTGWNLTVVQWSQVPRPEWIASSATRSIEAADLCAWGIWLWEQGGPEWRIQSLAMLNQVSRQQWLASYFIDHVLAEVPPIPARATEGR